MASVLRENIKISLRAIRSQLMRTILTIVIISFGIMSLVGTLTSIDALKSSINSNFTNMGANTFTIRNREMTVRIGRNGKRPKKAHGRSRTIFQRSQRKNRRKISDQIQKKIKEVLIFIEPGKTDKKGTIYLDSIMLTE